MYYRLSSIRFDVAHMHGMARLAVLRPSTARLNTSVDKPQLLLGVSR